jgi:hypothetical protein
VAISVLCRLLRSMDYSIEKRSEQRLQVAAFRVPSNWK